MQTRKQNQRRITLQSQVRILCPRYAPHKLNKLVLYLKCLSFYNCFPLDFPSSHVLLSLRMIVQMFYLMDLGFVLLLLGVSAYYFRRSLILFLLPFFFNSCNLYEYNSKIYLRAIRDSRTSSFESLPLL